jgi:hypothetical protein
MCECRAAGTGKRFLTRLLNGLQYVPNTLITGTLGSYGLANRELPPDVEHGKAVTLTIARRIRIGQPADESGRSAGSNQRRRRSISCRTIVLPAYTSVGDFAALQPRPTEQRVPRPSRFGPGRPLAQIRQWTVKLMMLFDELRGAETHRHLLERDGLILGEAIRRHQETARLPVWAAPCDPQSHYGKTRTDCRKPW